MDWDVAGNYIAMKDTTRMEDSQASRSSVGTILIILYYSHSTRLDDSSKILHNFRLIRASRKQYSSKPSTRGRSYIQVLESYIPTVYLYS